MIRILHAEDHALVRDGIRLLISSQADMALAGETGSGSEVDELVRRLGPDVLLLDVGLPGLDGVAILKGLPAGATRVIVVTARLDAATVQACLGLGAAGYLTKEESSDELLAAIRSVAAGGRHVSPRIAALAKAPSDGGTVLTAREQEIIGLVALGLSSREIGLRLALTERTVRKHRENITRKIGARNAAEMTVYAIRNGLAVSG